MKSVQELEAIREKFGEGRIIRNDRHKGVKVVVSMGTCGIAAGGRAVVAAIMEEIAARKLEVQVTLTGCKGDCSLEPCFEVFEPGKEKASYTKATPESAAEVIRKLS